MSTKGTTTTDTHRCEPITSYVHSTSRGRDGGGTRYGERGDGGSRTGSVYSIPRFPPSEGPRFRSTRCIHSLGGSGHGDLKGLGETQKVLYGCKLRILHTLFLPSGDPRLSVVPEIGEGSRQDLFGLVVRIKWCVQWSFVLDVSTTRITVRLRKRLAFVGEEFGSLFPKIKKSRSLIYGVGKTREKPRGVPCPHDGGELEVGWYYL